MPFSAADRLITGLPRSGTSLINFLLNQCENTVSLAEPPMPILSNAAGLSHRQICAGRLGRLPAAEGLHVELSRKLEQIPAVAARQLYLLDWFFDKYRRVLSADQIL